MSDVEPDVRHASNPPDRIFLSDHVVDAEIGAFQSERGRTQRLRFAISVDLREQVDAGDDVDRVLSYDVLTDAVTAALAAERLNLLETLAERIAARVLAEPRAGRCRVRIEKLDRGPGALGVEIERARASAPVAVARRVRPVVVHLSDAAVASDRLGGWIDGLAGRPAIFCVGPGDAPAPRVADASAQRHIDLLAIEQNAWVLAARDARCAVTASRTELDWAMQAGHLSVWAPGKMVLDSPDAPRDTSDARALTLWLAQAVEAERLVYVGVEPPEGVRAETRKADAAGL